MGATYRYIVNDIQLTFQQLANDKKVTNEQVTYWVILVVNRIMAVSFRNGVRSGAYLNVYDNVPIAKGGAGVMPDIPYVELPADIFNLDMDDGVNYIAFDATPVCPNIWGRVFFQRSTFWDIKGMEDNPYEAPSGGKPYFVRASNILYLYGINQLPITNVELGLYTTVKPSLAEPFSLDDVVPLEDEDLLQVKYEVMKLARYSWLVDNDRAETGTDDTKINPNLEKAETVQETRQSQPTQ